MHIDCVLELGQQQRLAEDALATMVRRGGAICSLEDRAANVKSLDKLRCVTVNAQLAVHVLRCHSGVLLGVIGPVTEVAGVRLTGLVNPLKRRALYTD